MPAEAATRRAKLKPHPTSILIVGANARIRNAHAIELGTHGYDVECADSIETAFETYEAKPRALVLFAIDEHSRKEWDVYRSIASDHPEQPMGFALSGTQRLCSVSFGGAEVLQAQSADDLVLAVERLIGSADAGLELIPTPQEG